MVRYWYCLLVLSKQIFIQNFVNVFFNVIILLASSSALSISVGVELMPLLASSASSIDVGIDVGIIDRCRHH